MAALTKKPSPPARKQTRSAGADRVRRHRAKQRAAGFRLVQMWLPDTADSEFLAQARRDCKKINASADSHRVMEEMLSIADFSGWT
jgi:hypothetical protein